MSPPDMQPFPNAGTGEPFIHLDDWLSSISLSNKVPRYGGSMVYLRALDCSNYTSGADGNEITADDTARARDSGIALAITQALTPPPSYPRAGDAEHCKRQVRAWAASGVTTDAYLYAIEGGQPFPDKIALLDGEDIRQWWVDLEEKPPYTGDALTAWVRRHLELADAAPSTLGRPAGWYTAYWWIQWYLRSGGSLEPLIGRPGWWVQWTGSADPTAVSQVPAELKESLCIVQYTGSNSVAGITGVDLDVLTESEGSTLDVNVAPVPQEYRDKFALSGPYDWAGVAANLEGIIHELQGELSTAFQSDARAVLDRMAGILVERGYTVTVPNAPPVVEPQSSPDQGAAPSGGAPDSAPSA